MNLDSSREMGGLADGMISNASGQDSTDNFLKLEGIEGESQDDKHKGELQINYFDLYGWQGSSAGSGGGSGAGKVTFSYLRLKSPTSKASPKLFLACAKGDKIKSAILTCRVAGGAQEEFLKLTMSDAVVTYYSQYQQESDGAASISDYFQLDYLKLEIEYRPIQPDGKLGSPIKAGWDLKQNSKI